MTITATDQLIPIDMPLSRDEFARLGDAARRNIRCLLGLIMNEWAYHNTPFPDGLWSKVLTGATHALRSYEYHNSSTELAASVANTCDALVKRIAGIEA